MSAFYGVPEGREVKKSMADVPTPRVEPVDDPQYLISYQTPDRQFNTPRTTRFTRQVAAKTIPFAGVDFDAMVARG